MNYGELFHTVLWSPSARPVQRGEFVPGGQGIRVLWAEDPGCHWSPARPARGGRGRWPAGSSLTAAVNVYDHTSATYRTGARRVKEPELWASLPSGLRPLPDVGGRRSPLLSRALFPNHATGRERHSCRGHGR